MKEKTQDIVYEKNVKKTVKKIEKIS